MNLNNLSIIQANNLDMLFDIPKIEYLIDLKNENIKNYVFNELANDRSGSIAHLCSLIKANKVSDFDQLINYFILLKNANDTKKIASVSNFNSSDYFYPTSEYDMEVDVYVPFNLLLYVLSNHNFEANLTAIAETISMLTTYNMGNIYYKLLQYRAFWSDIDQINSIKELAKDCNDKFKYYILNFDCEKISKKTACRKKAQEAIGDYTDEKIKLGNYISNTIGLYKKGETISKIKSLM
jgi:hypothetical protein